MTARPRVLVVDDSAFARKVLRSVLSDDPRIEVVGYARDGLEALERIEELHPDVITLDLVMPGLDGPGVLEALRAAPNPPRVVVVSMTEAASPIAVAALQAGAFDIVHKPTALATDRLYELGTELVEKVLLAWQAPPSPRPAAPKPASAMLPAAAAVRTRIVVVGTSTGGPRALTLLASALPATFPVPIVAVVHMPIGFTQGLALRLDGDSALDVAEARDGHVIAAGGFAIGRAGANLQVASRRGDCVAIVGIGAGSGASSAAGSGIHRPSVDELFISAASAFGPATLGVVLTGMGTDGLEGARAIRAAGGRILVEDAATCVVHGMPRAVEEAGLANEVVRLDAMAEAILRAL